MILKNVKRKHAKYQRLIKYSYANILILWNWNAQFLKRLLAFTRDTAVQRKRPRLKSIQDWGKTLLEKNVTKCNRKAGQSGRQFLRNYKLVRIVCDLFFAWLPVVSWNGLFLVFSLLKSYFILEFVLGVAGE